MWLTSEIPNQLEDLNGSELTSVENFDFKVKIVISRFDIEEFNVAEHHFEFLNQIGGFDQTSNVNTNVTFEKKVNSSKFSVRIIPIMSGGFYFSFGNVADDLQEVSLIDTNCIQSIDLNYNMNNSNNENNLFFIKENAGIDKDTPIENLQKYGTYAFWVVE